MTTRRRRRGAEHPGILLVAAWPRATEHSIVKPAEGTVSDLLNLTEKAFHFLTDDYDFDPPTLKHEPREDYDYVEYRRNALRVAVVFFPEELPVVEMTQVPAGMDAPEGLPSSKVLFVDPDVDETRYPGHVALRRPLARWLSRDRARTNLEKEVEQRVSELGAYVRDHFGSLVESLVRQEA